MRYRIEYADGRCCSFASSRKDLLDWLKTLKDEKVVDIRKVYKNGVTDSVIDSYRSYPFNEKLEMKLQKIFQKLSDKQRTILFDYMTETSNKCSDLNEFYYRMGLRDGLMLKEVIQVMLDALTV